MSEDRAPRLSIVIVNYNTREDLRACLRALTRASETPQIIVVDNASQDGSAAAVRSEFPAVELLAFPENRWYCGGNNLGLARARGKYAMLLNPDTEIEVDALTRLVDFMEQQPDYDGCTGQMYYPDGAIQQTGSRIPTFSYLLLQYSALGRLLSGARMKLWQRHSYGDWERETDRDIAVMPGSCFLMRREALRLDERYLLYFWEDAHSAARRKAGRALRFRYLSAARIMHHESSSTRNRLAQRIFFRDLAAYLRVQYGLFAWVLWWVCALPLRLWLEWRPRR